MIKDSIQKRHVFSSEKFFTVHGRWYIAVFLLLSLIRLILGSDRGLQHNLHDPMLYLETAKYIACGDWLGPLRVVTLSKSCIYPLFISLSLISGIPYLLIVDICWCLSALLAVWALFPILKKTGSLLLYAALLFQPMVYQQQQLSIHELYLILIFCSVCSFAGVWVRYSANRGFPLNWLAGGGLFLSLAVHTREEGIVWFVLVPVYAMLILIRNIRRDRLPAGKLIRILFFAGVILFITYAAVDLPIRMINYRQYRYFGCNIRTSHAWKQFTGTLLGAARELDPRWDIRIPVRYDILDRLYELSPNLARLKPYIRRNSFFAVYPAERFPKEELKRCPDLVNNIKGGFLQWELLAAMVHLRLMKENNWHNVETFLDSVVEDFRIAARSGKLKNFTVRVSNLPPYDRQMRDWFLRKIGWTAGRTFLTAELLEPVKMEIPDMNGIQFHENELYRSLKSDNYFMKPFYFVAGWGFQPESGNAALERKSFITPGRILSYQIQSRPDVRSSFAKKAPGISDRVGFGIVLDNPMLEIRNDKGMAVYQGNIMKQKSGKWVHLDIVQPIQELPHANWKKKWLKVHCLGIRAMMKWLLCASAAMTVFLLLRTLKTGVCSPHFKLLIAGTSLWFSGAVIFLTIVFANVMLHCPRSPDYLYPALLLLYDSYCVILTGGCCLVIRELLAGRLRKGRRHQKGKKFSP